MMRAWGVGLPWGWSSSRRWAAGASTLPRCIGRRGPAQTEGARRMQAARPTRVNLPAPLRVVIFYDTIHVNSENVVHFVADIYGHDRVLDEALRRAHGDLVS